MKAADAVRVQLVAGRRRIWSRDEKGEVTFQDYPVGEWTVLDRMFADGRIDQDEFAAGLRFGLAFARAGYAARFGLADSIGVLIDGGKLWREPIGGSIDAQREVEAALKYIGERPAFVLTYLVGHGEDQGAFLTRCYNNGLRCDRQALQFMLRMALSSLAAFYMRKGRPQSHAA